MAQPNAATESVAKAAPVDSAVSTRKWVGIPFVAYTPETKVILGLDGTLLFRPKHSNESTTRTSIINSNAIYTSNKQTAVFALFDIFTREEKYLIHGLAAASNFSLRYYGIGDRTPFKDHETYKFHILELNALFYRNLFSKFYLGLGWRYVHFTNLQLEPGKQLATQQVAGSMGNLASGLWLSALFDNRDNIYNSYSGYYLNFTVNLNQPSWGSTRGFNTYKTDLRYYLKPFKQRLDIIAFQLFGNFTTGDVPFMELATLGSDRIMRGYYVGRFRDKFFIAGQAEYRRPLFWRIGATLWAAVGEVAPTFHAFGQQGTDGLKPNLGAGLRYRVLKNSRLNIRFDAGLGSQGIHNFYLQIAEAF